MEEKKGCLTPNLVLVLIGLVAIVYLMKESAKMSSTAQGILSLMIFIGGFAFMILKDKK